MSCKYNNCNNLSWCVDGYCYSHCDNYTHRVDMMRPPLPPLPGPSPYGQAPYPYDQPYSMVPYQPPPPVFQSAVVPGSPFHYPNEFDRKMGRIQDVIMAGGKMINENRKDINDLNERVKALEQKEKKEKIKQIHDYDDEDDE